MDLKSSIIQTLSYFNFFDYPLTKEELFEFLWRPPRVSYEDFLNELEKIKNENSVETKCGYYFLPGRNEITEKRRAALVESEIKIKIAKRAIKKIRSIPFLRAVFVCNSVGAEEATKESDIDFLIVAARGRVWIVRFFANLILRVFGMRTYGSKQADKICLSFFIDEDNLDLSRCRIEEDDIHFAYWTRRMIPLYDPLNYYQKFLNANNWVEKFLPYIFKEANFTSRVSVSDTLFAVCWKKAWEKMWAVAYGNMIEKQAREWQLAKIKFSVKEKAVAGDKGVIFGDGIIKLHENDCRLAIRKKFFDCRGF
ncbi:MAG: hypothetical protein PHY40_02405 [Patescibacteria group bacterium]|nr:hypothetical protein [Patescibacteria group bacterium]